ncbi:hypothetical protein ABZ345_32405 [Lentzea sp. NPDC005914]|uniref:hypothetical protein n=1 Tax=Lentzea sp. NPDC005914 TaxID=3154572 RepID=UPI0033E5564C
MIEEIDRALRGTPSKLAFRALCSVADADSVPYCEQQLASWPDELREAPWSWLAALESGFTKPTWPLVRSLDLSSRRQGLRYAALPDPRRPEMRAVTRIRLGWPSDEELEAFTETADRWENLRSFSVRMVTDDDTDVLARFARTDAAARLESLVLVSVTDTLWHFGKPSFRLHGRTRLRHIGVMAADLAHLLREGLAPDLRSAEVLVATADEARELASCAGLASLERLEIGFRCGKNGEQPLWRPFFGNVIEADEEACAEFFSRADLRNLRSLRVRGTVMGLGREGLGARGVEAILPVVPQLTELTLQLLPVDDKSIGQVLSAVDHERIEKLVLSDLVATDHLADAFAGPFPRLRHLDLSHNHLGADGVRRLLGAGMPVLEHLDLSGRWGGSPHYARPDLQPVGDGGALAAAGLENLRTVRLSAIGLGPEGLAALLRLDGLEDLDVSGNPMGSLPHAPAWGSVRTLDLADCGLSDSDVAALPAESALVSLSLAYNGFSSDGARALASWPVLPQLWMLDLHDHTIGDDGLAALASSRAAQRLVELDVEQDVWNAHRRSYLTPLPAEVLARESFPALDAMFLGTIDEYHGSRNSTGVPELPVDPRPELVAFIDHLDDDYEAPEEDRPPQENDFRTNRAEAWAGYLADAEDFARRMMSGEIGWPP